MRCFAHIQRNLINLIFIGPCIVIYSYITTNMMQLFSQIILVKRSLCFGGFNVHHQEHKTAYTATVYVKQLLLPAAIGGEMELHAVYAVFSS